MAFFNSAVTVLQTCLLYTSLLPGWLPEKKRPSKVKALQNQAFPWISHPLTTKATKNQEEKIKSNQSQPETGSEVFSGKLPQFVAASPRPAIFIWRYCLWQKIKEQRSPRIPGRTKRCCSSWAGSFPDSRPCGRRSSSSLSGRPASISRNGWDKKPVNHTKTDCYLDGGMVL